MACGKCGIILTLCNKEVQMIEEIEVKSDGSKKVVRRTVEKGISFGSALAMVISFVTWKSVLWAVIHGLFGWFYVIYFLIRYR